MKDSKPIPINLLGPSPGRTSTGFRGMRSDRTEQMGVGMGGGIWGNVQNLRSFGGSFKTRKGGTSLQASMPSGCFAPADFWCVSLNGVNYQIGAFWDTSAYIRLYLNTGSLDSWTWTEMTETAGWDGNTRFAPSLSVSGATNASPIVIATSTNHGLRDSQRVLIQAVTGNTAANTFAYAKVSGVGTPLTHFALYSDIGLTVPIAGNGAYAGAGKISTVYQMAADSWTTPPSITNNSGNRDVLMVSDGITTRLFDPESAEANVSFPLGTVWFHADISDPVNAAQWTLVSTFNRYSQIATTTGARTYQVAKTTTQAATYRFDETTVAPYNAGSNFCIKLTENVAPVGNTAGFPLTAQLLFSTQFSAQMLFAVEGIQSTITDLLANTKMYVSPNQTNLIAIASSTNATPIVVTTAVTHNIATGTPVQIKDHLVNTNANGSYFARSLTANTFSLYDTAAHANAGGATGAIAGNGVGGATGTVHVDFHLFYDPTSSNPKISSEFFIQLLDSGSTNRQWFGLDLTSLTTAAQGQTEQRLAGYIKFERINVASAAALTLTILMLAVGGTLPGGSDFALAYESVYGFMEGPGYFAPAGIETVSLSTIGGPSLVTGGASGIATPLIPLPQTQAIFYDYNITFAVPTPGTGTFNGSPGLGVPNALALYLKAAGDSSGAYIYFASVGLIGITGTSPIWTYLYSGVTATIATSDSPLNLIDANDRSDGRNLPTSGQKSIPAATTYKSAYGRFFAGNPVIDSAPPGQIWFSQFNMGNRFMAVPIDINGLLDETFGSRILFPGETIQCLVGNTDGSGQNELICLTDKAIRLIGNLANDGTSYAASRLSTPVRLGPQGTLSPGSAVNSLGAMLYVDQFGEIIMYANGGLSNISQENVGDKISSIPAGRISFVTGGSLNKHFYIGYTVTSQNVNALVWNVTKRYWEANDLLPATWDFFRTRTVVDPTKSGGGQRLICITSTGKVFGYEESTSEFGSTYVACSLTTGWFWDPQGRSYISDMGFWGDTVPGQTLLKSLHYLETNAIAQRSINLFNPLNTNATYFSATEGSGDIPSYAPSDLALYTVTGATNSLTLPVVITPNAPLLVLVNGGTQSRSLEDGDRVTIASVSGTVCNGSWFAKVTGQTGNNFALYQDILLTIPVVSNVPYVSGGTIAAPVWKSGAYRMFAQYDWNSIPSYQVDRIIQTVASQDGGELGGNL